MSHFHRIAFEKVTFGYTPDHKLLLDVDFEFPLNEIVWIKGALGSGVSTLLRLLVGSLFPTRGKIWLNETSLSQAPFQTLSHLRTKIGYGFDEGGLISNLTLEGNLLLPLRFHGLETPEQIAKRVEKYLADFRLMGSRNLRPALASSGVKRSCLLARAFIHQPELLILDNPTRSLNQEAVDNLRAILVDHRKQWGLRHVFIASDDEAFFKGLNPLILELSDRKVIFKNLDRKVQVA